MPVRSRFPCLACARGGCISAIAPATTVAQHLQHVSARRRLSADLIVHWSVLMIRIGLLLLLSLSALSSAWAQANFPAPVEGDVVVKNFRFKSNEVLPELRLHYRTVGKLERDAKGSARNAVLIMHGTGGSGAQFLQIGRASCRERV